MLYHSCMALSCRTSCQLLLLHLVPGVLPRLLLLLLLCTLRSRTPGVVLLLQTDMDAAEGKASTPVAALAATAYLGVV
jgi:hypothetical protein